MERFIQRHPIWFSLLLSLLSAFVGAAVVAVASVLAPTLPMMTLKFVVQSMVTLFAIGAISALGWWRAAGFGGSVLGRRPLLFLFPALLALLPLVTGFRIPELASSVVMTIGFIVCVNLMVGFQEEAIGRGVILGALLPGGIMRAVLLSAVIFGASHLTLFAFGASPIDVLITIGLATVFGVGYAALRILSGTIWPLVIIHSVVDIVAVFTPNGGLLVLLGGLLIGVYGLFLLRHEWLPGAVKPQAATVTT